MHTTADIKFASLFLDIQMFFLYIHFMFAAFKSNFPILEHVEFLYNRQRKISIDSCR